MKHYDISDGIKYSVLCVTYFVTSITRLDPLITLCVAYGKRCHRSGISSP